jgi:hypothetical protein|tara:strand:+ start:1845 stop:2249 length:405 start_codon:yes stop_codon:yes gene_type:complete
MSKPSKELTCEDVIVEHYNGRLTQIRETIAGCGYMEDKGIDWLDFSYVGAHTFNGQERGYFRWQLSWGGPSDEYRIFMEEDGSIEHITYHFMDWYDGAEMEVYENEIWEFIRERFGHEIRYNTDWRWDFPTDNK